MSRTRPSDRSMAEALANEALRDRATRPLVGPRGGRYEPVGEVRDIRIGQSSEDWMFNRWSVAGRLDARYVRPSRRLHPTTLASTVASTSREPTA